MSVSLREKIADIIRKGLDVNEMAKDIEALIGKCATEQKECICKEPAYYVNSECVYQGFCTKCKKPTLGTINCKPIPAEKKDYNPSGWVGSTVFPPAEGLIPVEKKEYCKCVCPLKLNSEICQNCGKEIKELRPPNQLKPSQLNPEPKPKERIEEMGFYDKPSMACKINEIIQWINQHKERGK